MGNFLQSLKITGGNEGGYSNNPNDHGGETYAGIARKFWPNWPGWEHVDKIKTSGITTPHGIDIVAKQDTILQNWVNAFYKQNFWDVNKLDQVLDQRVCDTIYDFGVNSGTGEAAKILQNVIGVHADGIIGPATISAVNALNGKEVYDKYNNERRAFYEELAKNPGQEQFLRSWLSRLTEY
jgi:lysozyme family protein